jgi:hypothetical protein
LRYNHKSRSKALIRKRLKHPTATTFSKSYKEKWQTYGLPLPLRVDKGKKFSSRTSKEAMTSLGCTDGNGDLVICDIVTLDFYVETEDGRQVRPIITVVADSLTNYPLGYSLTFSKTSKAGMELLGQVVFPRN